MKIQPFLLFGLALSLTGCATMNGEQAKVSKNIASTSADTTAKVNTNLQSVISASQTDVTSLTSILYRKTSPTATEIDNAYQELNNMIDSINYAIETIESFKASSDKIEHVNQVLYDLNSYHTAVEDMRDALTTGNTKKMSTSFKNMKSYINLLEQDQQVLFE